MLGDAEVAITKAKGLVLTELKKDRDLVVSRMVARTIEQRLTKFDAKAEGDRALADNLAKLVAGIDVLALYAEVAKDVDAAIASDDYEGALRLYANKGLGARIGAFFGQKDFPDYLRRLLVSSKGKEVTEAIRNRLPKF